MSDVWLPEIPGDPAGMRALAGELRGRAGVVAAVSGTLARRVEATLFVGPAAERFRERIAASGERCRALSERLLAVSSLLESAATEVEAAQRERERRLAELRREAAERAARAAQAVAP